jgi:dihydrofolate synthase/folylpolyglutamate synthase
VTLASNAGPCRRQASRLADEDADPRYQAALAALARRGRFGIRLGLGRTRALLRRLGDPQLGLRGVLIAGTNGKGSVQQLVGEALRAAGHRVGQTPKPHLISYRERIVVDGRPVSAADFASVVERALDTADAVTPRLGPPTEFEVLTAAAFDLFRQVGVEVAVVEVGLGGRLDATNAWQGGVSAITNVALDHTEHLGPTIAAIAREKAHIVKRRDHAVVTGADPEALAIIARRARRLGVPLRRATPLHVLGMDRAGLRLVSAAGAELRLGLLGRHQAANAAVALAVLDELAAAGIAAVEWPDVERAFAGARWPGRLELIAVDSAGFCRPAPSNAPHPTDPDVILDGAHNPHGAAALAEAVTELAPLLSPGRQTLLAGVLADKDVTGMIQALASSATLAGARLIATSVPGTTRSLAAAELARAWGREAAVVDDPAAVVDDPAAALDEALETARRAGGPLIVCGSLYLVGFVRGRLDPDSGLDAPDRPD